MNTVTFPACVIETHNGRTFAIMEQRPRQHVSRLTKQSFVAVTGRNMTPDGLVLVMNTRVHLNDIKRIVRIIDNDSLRKATINDINGVYDTLVRRLGASKQYITVI
jgi:hypothetical protein